MYCFIFPNCTATCHDHMQNQEIEGIGRIMKNNRSNSETAEKSSNCALVRYKNMHFIHINFIWWYSTCVNLIVLLQLNVAIWAFVMQNWSVFELAFNRFNYSAGIRSIIVFIELFCATSCCPYSFFTTLTTFFPLRIFSPCVSSIHVIVLIAIFPKVIYRLLK